MKGRAERISKALRDGERPGEVARRFGISRQRVNQVANPEKHRARAAVARALRSGVLVRPRECTECGMGERVLEAHHEDYARPLEVVWLCIYCHQEQTTGKSFTAPVPREENRLQG